MKIVGLVLIALGVLALMYGAITYTSRDKVIDLGPIQATADREHSIPVPPLAGAALVGVGAVLLVVGRKK